jgi:hypothetical protein
MLMNVSPWAVLLTLVLPLLVVGVSVVRVFETGSGAN